MCLWSSWSLFSEPSLPSRWLFYLKVQVEWILRCGSSSRWRCKLKVKVVLGSGSSVLLSRMTKWSDLPEWVSASVFDHLLLCVFFFAFETVWSSPNVCIRIWSVLSAVHVSRFYLQMRLRHCGTKQEFSKLRLVVSTITLRKSPTLVFIWHGQYLQL